MKALDGHPTPATPFVRLSTGASGVGLPASIGLADRARWTAMGRMRRWSIRRRGGGHDAGPRAGGHGRRGHDVSGNVVLHVDWNQASIDSNRVCRDGDDPGDYVQWNPAELAYLHDWNVIQVPHGMLSRRSPPRSAARGP